MTKNENLRFSIHTLGCKLNYAESSAIAEKLIALGWHCVDFSEPADIVIVHSCTVTQTAEKKSRQAFSKAYNLNTNSQFVLLGCMADSVSDSLKEKYPFLYILGNDRKMLLPDLLSGNLREEDIASSCEKHFFPAAVSGERTRSFLKIQDGCDYFCSYCAIPYVRGRSRSGTINEILSQIEQLISKGIQEIVFTGVNAADFGKNNGESFHQLLVAIEQKNFPIRFRLSSVEPDLLEEASIELIASSKCFMPHFHLPLQSGSDSVLKDMNRKYDSNLFAQKVNGIKSLIPNACIAADIIVGFPSEGEAEFDEALEFVNSLPISYLHIFPYSDRPKAKASKAEKKNSPQQIKDRVQRMSTISGQKKNMFYHQNLGKSFSIIAESERKQGLMFGFTENYIKVGIPYQEHLINQKVQVILKSSNGEDYLIGEVENE